MNHAILRTPPPSPIQEFQAPCENKSSHVENALLISIPCGKNRAKPFESTLDSDALFILGRKYNEQRVLSNKKKVNYIRIHSQRQNMISREHARISVCGGSWTITDVGSNNGVYLNCIKLDTNKRYVLHSSDIIDFGSRFADPSGPPASFLFHVPGNEEESSLQTIQDEFLLEDRCSEISVVDDKLIRSVTTEVLKELDRRGVMKFQQQQEEEEEEVEEEEKNNFKNMEEIEETPQQEQDVEEELLQSDARSDVSATQNVLESPSSSSTKRPATEAVVLDDLHHHQDKHPKTNNIN